MQNLAKHVLRKTALDGFAISQARNLRLLKRRLGGVDRGLIEKYFAEQKTKRLHIGCGENILSDWLNSDFYPRSNRMVHLDATGKFPFPANTFDYIFSEHMIEHISYPDGLSMLGECHRILKNNGKIRISTPNLQFVIDLYQEKKTALQEKYIAWSSDNFIDNAPYHDETFVINNFVRDWGHLFIYDEKTLRLSLQKAGFENIIQFDLNKSHDEFLINLENEKRMPEGFLRLETITLEGTKV